MALITITGNDVRDSTGRPDNRPWTITASTYQDGEGGVITDKTSTPLYPIAGVLTFQVEAGITAWIRTPDETRYLVRIPDEDADLWGVIEAGVAYPPTTSQDLLAAAVGQYVVTHSSIFRSYAEPVDAEDPDTLWQWKDGADGDIGDPVDFTEIIPVAVAEAATAAVAEAAVDADLASRAFGLADDGEGGVVFASDGVPTGGPSFEIGAAWTAITGKPLFAVAATVGDDSTDAHTAIQAAVDAAEAAGGGVVLVPPGVYRVSESIVMDDDNVTLQGCGRSATVLKTLGDFAIIEPSASGLCIRDLQLLGDSTDTKTLQMGINSDGMTDSLIHNIHVKDMGYDGICLLRNTSRVTVSDCVVEGCEDDGINIGGNADAGCIGNVVVGNTIHDCTHTGIHISTDSSFTTVTGNTIVDCDTGIDTHQPAELIGLGNHTISANTIKDCESFGIEIFNSDNNIVIGNNVSGGERSLKASSSSYTQFIGNHCDGGSIIAFSDDSDCSDLTIAENVFTGASQGLSAIGPRAIIKGNRVQGVTTTAYSIQTASTAVDSIISDNIVSGGSVIGINCLSDDCVVSGNRVSGGTIGIVANKARPVITGNRISGTGGDGVNIATGGDNALVSSNIITGVTGQGIECAGDDCIISGNATITTSSHGIYANATARAQIVGNHISSAGAWGINILGGSGTFVANNVTVSSTTGSIQENGASSGTVVVNNIWDSTVTLSGTTPVNIKPIKSSAYTPTNVSTDRAYDANSTDVAELADVLGTLIADLQAKGVLG